MARCPDCIHQYCCKYDRFFGVNEVENKCIYFKPTADVVEVKHGHWIRKDYKPCGHDYLCSVCGFGVPLEYKHCPECGAKMDKKESEGFSDV